PRASGNAEGRDERVPRRGARDAPRRPARPPGPGGGACVARPGLRRRRPGAHGQTSGARGEGGVARRSAGPGAGDVRPVAREPGDRGLRRRRGRRGRPMKRVAVIVFPGSNCDAETLAAAQAAGSDAYFVWHRDTDLRQADVVILPGGFSYGDYLRSGAIARFSKVMGAVTEHARAGGAVLGICNGFQILCEAGLLPGGLMRRAGLRFLSAPVSFTRWRLDMRRSTLLTCALLMIATSGCKQITEQVQKIKAKIAAARQRAKPVQPVPALPDTQRAAPAQDVGAKPPAPPKKP